MSTAYEHWSGYRVGPDGAYHYWSGYRPRPQPTQHRVRPHQTRQETPTMTDHTAAHLAAQAVLERADRDRDAAMSVLVAIAQGGDVDGALGDLPRPVVYELHDADIDPVTYGFFATHAGAEARWRQMESDCGYDLTFAITEHEVGP